jgi:hypothetical protein
MNEAAVADFPDRQELPKAVGSEWGWRFGHGAGHSNAPATITSSPAAFSDSEAART